MKKISFVLIAALALLALTGCPTAHKDAEWAILPVGDIVGDMNGDGAPLMMVEGAGVAVGTYTFTYAADMNAWGGSGGTVNFKIRKVAGDWGGGDYGAGEKQPELGGDAVALDGTGNVTVNGLEAGKTYEITVTADASNVSVAIAAL